MRDFVVFGAGSGDEIEDVDVLGINLSDEGGLDSLVGVPQPEVEELEGDVGADCDFATEVAEVDGFFCHRCC